MSIPVHLTQLALQAREDLTSDIASLLVEDGGDSSQLDSAEPIAYSWFMRIAVLALLGSAGLDTHIGSATRPQSNNVVTGIAHWRTTFPHIFDDASGTVNQYVPVRTIDTTDLVDRLTHAMASQDRPLELLGWLHQFWMTSDKRRANDDFRGRLRVNTRHIAPVTQLFTPQWIAQTLAVNSIARVWSAPKGVPGGEDFWLGHPPQAPCEVPTDLTILDPACGAGHLLIAAFDVLARGYAACGVEAAEAATLIVGQHLHGLDIDRRAAALASFVVSFKAWELAGVFVDAEPKISVIEPVSFSATQLQWLRTRAGDVDWEIFADADLYGSLLEVPADALSAAQAAQAEIENDPALEESLTVWMSQAATLARTHDVVIANPPYLGTRHMSEKMREFAHEHYRRTKGDLCTMFIERAMSFLRDGGCAGLVTSESWLSTGTFAPTRELVRNAGALPVVVDIDNTAFAARLNTVAFVVQKGVAEQTTTYTRVTRQMVAAGPLTELPVPSGSVHTVSLSDLAVIPGEPFAFEMPPAALASYTRVPTVGDVVEVRQGMATKNNERFLRFWWEVDPATIGRDHVRGGPANPDWVPYNKGGTPTRWWGNQDYVVRWRDEGRELREAKAKASRTPSFFRPSVSWSNIAVAGARFRLFPPGFAFDVAGMSAFASDEKTRLNLLGWLNSPPAIAALDALAPTLNYQVGDVARLPAPAIESADDHERVAELVELARSLWVLEETAHEFGSDPLASRGTGRIEDHIATHRAAVADIHHRIADLELRSARYWSERLSRVTALGPEAVRPEHATTWPVLSESELVKNLISFAIGSLLGRWNLKSPTGEGTARWDVLTLTVPGAAHDATMLLQRWIARFFGTDFEEENITYLVGTVGDLRGYLGREFADDHTSRYRGRPIYWRLSSPQGHFGALVYAHRFSASTVVQLRDEHVPLALELAEFAGAGDEVTEDLLAYHRNLVQASEAGVSFDPEIGMAANLARLKGFGLLGDPD